MMQVLRNTVFFVSYIFLLSIASVIVVFQGAMEEPFVVLRKSEAFVQVGVGFALIVLWIQLAAILLLGVAGKRIPKPWLFALLWIAVAVFYLCFCPFGYIEDIVRYAARNM